MFAKCAMHCGCQLALLLTALLHRNRAFYNGSFEDLEQSKKHMNLTLTLGSGTPIDAAAHFRGVSSFRDCASRKSLDINLAGAHERRLQPGSATDRLFLISMCADDRFVRTQLANTLAALAGVYRVPQRYVRLLVAHTNGTTENLGVYLLVEDPDYTFEKDASALASIVRRRSDAERAEFPDRGTPLVELPKDSADAPAQHTPAAAAALARYDMLVATSVSCNPLDDSCYTQLAALMDFDMYLRWVAFCNFVGLGDYADQVFFATSAELSGAWYWSINAWDSACARAAPCLSPALSAAHRAPPAQWTTRLSMTPRRRATAATTTAWMRSLTRTGCCSVARARWTRCLCARPTCTRATWTTWSTSCARGCPRRWWRTCRSGSWRTCPAC